MSKTVHEIVKEYLTQNGYDGLVCWCCGCGIDDLFPCGSEDCLNCQPAYKIYCDGCNRKDNCEYRAEYGCEFCFSVVKPLKFMTKEE